MDPSKDMRIGATFYAVMPSPTDGSVWGTLRGSPGAIVRIDPTKNPHKSLAEQYNVPLPGFGPRGGDIDKQGRVWVSLASGHMGVLRSALVQGPAQRPEGDRRSLPRRLGVPPVSRPGLQGHRREQRRVELLLVGRPAQHLRARRRHADVDRQPDGRPGGADKDGKMVSIRVPYPLGFYAKGFDGRIDDPNAGWKGRGLWAANGDRTPWLIEGGKGTKPLAAHFQLRPDPLAH